MVSDLCWALNNDKAFSNQSFDEFEVVGWKHDICVGNGELFISKGYSTRYKQVLPPNPRSAGCIYLTVSIWL